VVVASGARYRRPLIENLNGFEGRGVWYWASPIEARLCAEDPAREALFFGAVPAAVLAQSERSVLFVSSGGRLAETPAAAPPKAPGDAPTNAALAGAPGRAAS
jgi:thioredoxin reductase (NADPH)